MSVFVAPFNTKDTAAVRQLLVDGLSERWGAYEPRFNPDLEAFPESYSGSLILVARAAGAVVGTGTLRPVSPHRSEVVRMSTAPMFRRNGVATTILRLLLDHARATGTREIALETTSSWASAVAFYSKHGFTRTHEHDGNTHFVYLIR
jgi:ribosomal protein S18 acetylase RimI-like enzyme